MHWVLPLLCLIGVVVSFDCDSDTILRLATNHRAKDVEEECHRDKDDIICEEQKNVDNLWNEYQELQREYKKLVNNCVQKRRDGVRVRRSEDHDPNDPNIDHSGHNHRRRRHDHQDHDPKDPNIDHTGHNHKKRHHVTRRCVNQEGGCLQSAVASRSRRQVCKNKASEELTKLHNEFKEFCDRENICLPDEDLPEGPSRDKFKEVQNQRAKKYTSYLLEVASCNAT